ncbi:hypothetical protein QE152_g37340 [Popillia japonica]|uniref:Integrase zinc-binding domain-containing protein n=1 Tax=Popillia japonica TaxID=7064 RepID=A0AAW1IA39_POPJA
MAPIRRSTWAQWDSLVVEDGVLKRVLEEQEGGRQRTQLIVPRCRVADVLRELHDGTGGGHLGGRKTLEKLQLRNSELITTIDWLLVPSRRSWSTFAGRRKPAKRGVHINYRSD